MNRFNTIENKGIVMRSLIVLTVMLLAVGAVSAQENVTAEDFTTKKPSVDYITNFQLEPVDILNDTSSFQNYENSVSGGVSYSNDNLILSTSVASGYVTDFNLPNGPSEWMRGNLNITYTSPDDDVTVRLVRVNSADFSNSETVVLDTLPSTSSEQTRTVTWDEFDLENEGFTALDSYDVQLFLRKEGGGSDATIDKIEFKERETTYQETMYAGTVSTTWEDYTTGFSDHSAIESEVVESNGEYRWELTTNGVLGIQRTTDITPTKLQYWSGRFAVPKGGALEYGVVADSDDSITYGYRIENRVNDTGDNKILPIIDGEPSENPAARPTPPYNGENLADIQEYYFTLGGLVDGERTFSESVMLDGTQIQWNEHQYNYDGQDTIFYWRAQDLFYGNQVYKTLPQPHGNSFDAVRIKMESLDDQSHTFTLGNFTYGEVPSETAPNETASIGTDLNEIEDRNEIIDGGIVDSTLTIISNYFGIGIDATRFILGILISLGVGLAAGWSEEYGSTVLGVVAFILTFVTSMLIGLVPMVEGIIFLLIIGGIGWISWKNKSQQVVVNE